MKKKQPPKKAARPVRPKPALSGTDSRTPTLTATPPTTSAQPPPRVAPRRAAGRLHRATLTPAGMRGRDLIRFLRIHAKKPYGKRGEEAIRQMAVEVGHLGNLELNARD